MDNNKHTMAHCQKSNELAPEVPQDEVWFSTLFKIYISEIPLPKMYNLLHKLMT